MWCFVVRSAQGARILNPLMVLATPRMRTSARADFPLMLSTSSSTNNHYVITLTKPFSRIPCTLNFLIIHTRAIFIIIRAHEQSTNYLLEAVARVQAGRSLSYESHFC